MARYGLAGRMVRSPLNPLWTVGQGVRGLAGAATAAMPAVAEMGDRMVDEAAPEIGKAGGEIARALLPKNPGIAQMAERLAPDAAKMLGRGAYMSAVGAANGLADTLTLENTAGRNLAALAQAGAMSMPQRRPQEEKGPNASLRGQIDEDSARINARIAAGDFAPPAPAQDAGAPEAKGAVPPPAPKPSAPEDEFKDVPTTQLKGATVTGAFGQGNAPPKPVAVAKPPPPQDERQAAWAGAAPAISAHLKDVRDNIVPAMDNVETAKKIGMGMMGAGALSLGAGLMPAGMTAGGLLGTGAKRALDFAPVLAQRYRQGPQEQGLPPLPGGNRPALPMKTTPRGPVVGGIGSGGRVPLPGRPGAAPPVKLTAETVEGPLTPVQLQRLQDVINSNPRLMQLVMRNGGRVDAATRRFLETQVQQDPLTTVREALRSYGERPM